MCETVCSSSIGLSPVLYSTGIALQNLPPHSHSKAPHHKATTFDGRHRSIVWTPYDVIGGAQESCVHVDHPPVAVAVADLLERIITTRGIWAVQLQQGQDSLK